MTQGHMSYGPGCGPASYTLWQQISSLYFGGKKCPSCFEMYPSFKRNLELSGCSEAASVSWGSRGHWKRPLSTGPIQPCSTYPLTPGAGPERVSPPMWGCGGACSRFPADTQADDLKGEGTMVQGPVITSLKKERHSTCSQDVDH